MAELVTIARPYAAAAFSHARAKRQLGEWSAMLAFLVQVLRNPQMRSALANSRLTREDRERTLLAVCGERLDGAARNLLILLVRNDRLKALPEIQTLYEQMKAEAESMVDARVDSAFPLSEEQLRALVARLEARTGRTVRATVQVNPALIGGVRVQLGDDVWDASVRGQLDTMAATLGR